jgi:transcriptional regulator with XRE-family HTH domain
LSKYGGIKLEYIRKGLRLTQEELAKKMGVSQSKVSRWERGINLEHMSIGEMIKISELVGQCPISVMCMFVNRLKYCNAMMGQINFSECYLMKKYHKDFMEEINESSDIFS